jgi:signal transduction histidine kinase
MPMARILVVDDDPVIIRLYQIILVKAGFELTVCVNGEQLLAALKLQKPDVIVLDVVLPDHTGLDLCARIKQDPEYLGIKIILVSGTAVSPSKVADGINIGADDYLVKPFDPKELLSRIRNCVKLKAVEEELRDKNQELKDLSNHLQHVREEERKFFAREVQEEVGQLVAVLKMEVDWLSINLPDASQAHKDRLLHASNTTMLIINTIRRIASSLRPSMLDELGLNASLDWQCREFAATNGISCAFKQADNDEGLSNAIKTALFRICQESLNNIVQHSSATRVEVSAITDGKNIILQITDNGSGFNPDAQKNSLGFIGMRERALAVKGELIITSQPGKGTTVSLTIPLN